MNLPAYKFDQEKHIHYLDGVRIPGVTGILMSEGFINFPDAPFMRDALYRGNYVHYGCHLHNKGILDYKTLLEQFRPYIDAWMKFCSREKIVKPLSEYNVFSVKWRYAGIIDCLFQERLLDIKTSKTKSPAWKYQTAGYQIAYEEITGNKIKERATVQLFETGDYCINPHKERSDTNNFLAILTTYKLKIKDGIKDLEGDKK